MVMCWNYGWNVWVFYSTVWFYSLFFICVFLCFLCLKNWVIFLEFVYSLISAQPIGGKSLPPWMQTGKAAAPSDGSAGPVKMVGSHEDSADQIKESEQEYRKQFSDRKKFFKQQMEQEGTLPIKVAAPAAVYRDRAPVAPEPETAVVLSPVTVPAQLRTPTESPALPPSYSNPNKPPAQFNPSPVKPYGGSQPGPPGKAQSISSTKIRPFFFANHNLQ